MKKNQTKNQKKSQKPKTIPPLVPKKVKGRVKMLKAISYKGHMVYLRQIDEEIFMYDLIFRGEIYSNYLIIKPRPGKKKLARWEVNQSAALVFRSAVTTIDMLLGKKLDKRTEEAVMAFESTRKKMVH